MSAMASTEQVLMSTQACCIDALKAEVAMLKLQNESLEIRLAAANDKITSLQQFCEGETAMRRTGDAVLEATRKSLSAALQSQSTLSNLRDHYQKEAETFRKELMRRGADDPRRPKPGCDTAFAALQVVCKWDRDECFEDLKNRRANLLVKIDGLRSGKGVMMDDVVNAMNKHHNWIMAKDYEASLLYVLAEMREQLLKIYDSLAPASAHEEWSRYPLRKFAFDTMYDVVVEDSESE